MASSNSYEVTLHCQIYIFIFILALIVCHHQVKAEFDDLMLDLWHIPLSSKEVGENFSRMNSIRLILRTVVERSFK